MPNPRPLLHNSKEGGITKVGKIAELSSSPNTGDLAIYNPEGYGKFHLRYDGAQWVVSSTFGQYQELPIEVGGSFNSDLFNVTTTSDPNVSASSGEIDIEHDQANTKQVWDAESKLIVPGYAQLQIRANMNGAATPSFDWASVQFWIGKGFHDLSMEPIIFVGAGAGGGKIQVDRYGDGGNFAASASGQGAPTNDTVQSSAFAVRAPFRRGFQADCQTTDENGNTSTGSLTTPSYPNVTNFGLSSESLSNVDTTPKFTIKTARLRV